MISSIYPCKAGETCYHFDLHRCGNKKLNASRSRRAKDFLLWAKVLQSCMFISAALPKNTKAHILFPVCALCLYQWWQKPCRHGVRERNTKTIRSQRKRMCSELLWKLDCQLELYKDIGPFKTLLLPSAVYFSVETGLEVYLCFTMIKSSVPR